MLMILYRELNGFTLIQKYPHLPPPLYIHFIICRMVKNVSYKIQPINLSIQLFKMGKFFKFSKWSSNICKVRLPIHINRQTHTLIQQGVGKLFTRVQIFEERANSQRGFLKYFFYDWIVFKSP